MLDRDSLRRSIPLALRELELEWPYRRARGKVRDLFWLPDARRVMVTTDRLSAFDRVLTALPYKGQVLNQLSAFWFERTADLIPNHLLAAPDPNVSVVRECQALPVEVIVRGVITGVTKTALWTLYEAGERHIYGYHLPEGLRKNDILPEPLITPTTKGGPGQHDERLTCAEVVQRGLVTPALWEQVQEAALAIFRRGQELAQGRGLILVDTKYEFGIAADGTLMLIDEVHTPDSSRFWTAESVERARQGGGEPENWDKEFLRLWYVAQGYQGEGEPPPLPDEVTVEMAWRNIALYEALTGCAFEAAPLPAAPRIVAALHGLLE